MSKYDEFWNDAPDRLQRLLCLIGEDLERIADVLVADREDRTSAKAPRPAAQPEPPEVE